MVKIQGEKKVQFQLENFCNDKGERKHGKIFPLLSDKMHGSLSLYMHFLLCFHTCLRLLVKNIKKWASSVLLFSLVLTYFFSSFCLAFSLPFACLRVGGGWFAVFKLSFHVQACMLSAYLCCNKIAIFIESSQSYCEFVRSQQKAHMGRA